MSYVSVFSKSAWSEVDLTNSDHTFTLFLLNICRGCVSHELQGSEESSHLCCVHHIQVQTRSIMATSIIHVHRLKFSYSLADVGSVTFVLLICCWEIWRSWCVFSGNHTGQVISSVFKKKPNIHILFFHFRTVPFHILYPFICNFLTTLNDTAGCEQLSVPLSNFQTGLPFH